jgi:hypothetical protein
MGRNDDPYNERPIIVRDKSSDDCDFLLFAERRLADSRDRMKEFKKIQNAFVFGSPERMRADLLFEEIEVIHQVMDHLCRQLRQRRLSS